MHHAGDELQHARVRRQRRVLGALHQALGHLVDVRPIAISKATNCNQQSNSQAELWCEECLSLSAGLQPGRQPSAGVHIRCAVVRYAVMWYVVSFLVM